MASHTLAELFTQYLADTNATHAPSTRYALQKFFACVLEDLGEVPLDVLTPDLLRAWQQRLSQRCKPSTVHKSTVRLRGALRFAVHAGWLDADPLAPLRTPAPGQGRVRFLSQEERFRLLAACRKSRNPHLYAIVVVALGTGGWKDEIRCLRWSAVDFGQGVVRFAQTTPSLKRAVPLLGEALTLLKERSRCRKLRIPWVFPRPDGRQPTPLESPWQTARAYAGIEDSHFNDLRHTYASSLAMSGATVPEIAALLGHQTMQQTLVYAPLMPSDPRAAVQRMLAQFSDTPPAVEASSVAPLLPRPGTKEVPWTAAQLLSDIDQVLRHGV